MTKMVLDEQPRKIWSLNQLKIHDFFVGIPTAEYYKNEKENQFIKLMLDAGYSTCHIYFLLFDFPEQKLLNKKFHNSFELVRFYRECNSIPVDDNITQLHDIDWQDIIDWLNKLQTLKLQVVSKSMNGFKNIRFLNFTNDSLLDEVGFSKWIL